MKYLVTLALVLLAYGQVSADESAEQPNERKLSGQNDFTKDYLEKVTDELAAERVQREADRRDHDKYLRRSGRIR